MKILVVYHSKTGNTEKMAEAVAEGARSAGAEVSLKKVSETTDEDLIRADGIIIGSPTYYGQMASEIKAFIDGTGEIRGKLEDKIGAAFTSSGSPQGGSQTTLVSILQVMLIHGMIVVGDPMASGGHYGAEAVGAPDAKALDTCRMLGARVARLAGMVSKG